MDKETFDMYDRFIQKIILDLREKLSDLKKKMENFKSPKSEDNPFCTNCKEPDCLVSLDGTCAMIRKYQSLEDKVLVPMELNEESSLKICGAPFPARSLRDQWPKIIQHFKDKEKS